MTNAVRVVAVSVVVALMFTGPFAPAVVAQQPQAQPQADAFRETMKGGPHEVDPGDVQVSEWGYGIAAGVASSFLVPGRIITCAAGSVVGVAALALTFGSAYQGFARALEEGCGGKWIVDSEDLRPDSPAIMPPGDRR
jgi:hypothetical protein